MKTWVCLRGPLCTSRCGIAGAKPEAGRRPDCWPEACPQGSDSGENWFPARNFARLLMSRVSRRSGRELSGSLKPASSRKVEPEPTMVVRVGSRTHPDSPSQGSELGEHRCHRHTMCRLYLFLLTARLRAQSRAAPRGAKTSGPCCWIVRRAPPQRARTPAIVALFFATATADALHHSSLSAATAPRSKNCRLLFAAHSTAILASWLSDWAMLCCLFPVCPRRWRAAFSPCY